MDPYSSPYNTPKNIMASIFFSIPQTLDATPLVSERLLAAPRVQYLFKLPAPNNLPYGRFPFWFGCRFQNNIPHGPSLTRTLRTAPHSLPGTVAAAAAAFIITGCDQNPKTLNSSSQPQLKLDFSLAASQNNWISRMRWLPQRDSHLGDACELYPESYPSGQWSKLQPGHKV